MERASLERLRAEAAEFVNEGDIPPRMRLQIYCALCPEARFAERLESSDWRERRINPAEVNIRRYLQLVTRTARRTLPVWYERGQHSADLPWKRECLPMPRRLIDLAEAVLRGDPPRPLNDEVIDKAYLLLGGIDSWMDWSACRALEAAYHAVLAASGVLPFDRMPGAEAGDEPHQSYDAAAEAADALSVIELNPPPAEAEERTLEDDPNARCAFWRWWLDEAVPEAAG